MSIKNVEFFGEKAVKFCAGGYEAVVLPGYAANVVQLDVPSHSAELLRTPRTQDEFEAFKTNPRLFGIPPLLTPNRIYKGEFVFNGEKYNFPINTPTEMNLHGLIKYQAFEVVSCSGNDDECCVELAYTNDAKSDTFVHFPHEFKFTIKNELCKLGLKQTFTFENNSDCEVPFGFGLHTAFKLNFEGGSCKDYLCSVSLKRRYELTPALVPTEKFLELNAFEQALNTDSGTFPQAESLDCLYQTRSMNIANNVRGRARIASKSGAVMEYQYGEQFKHTVIYNAGGGASEFICIEPQTWATNAPNLALPKQESNMMSVKPGECFKESTYISYTKNGK